MKLRGRVLPFTRAGKMDFIYVTLVYANVEVYLSALDVFGFLKVFTDFSSSIKNEDMNLNILAFTVNTR